MGRSGYSDEWDADYANQGELYRSAIESAIRGRRGQAFLRELLTALDALPQKRLIAEVLEERGEVCALGSVAKLRGIDLTGIDPEAHRFLGKKFDIAPSLVAEVEFVNDDDFRYSAGVDETPEQRFERVRKWVSEQIWEWREVETDAG